MALFSKGFLESMGSMLSVADGWIWRKAIIPPYKHAIATYRAAMADFPSQIDYGGWQKIHHAITL